MIRFTDIAADPKPKASAAPASDQPKAEVTKTPPAKKAAAARKPRKAS